MAHKELYYSYPSGSKVAYDRKKQIGSKTVPSASKRSANYNRIVPASALNIKQHMTSVKVPYKTELLRQITGGSKTFLDLTRKRAEKNVIDSDSLDPANDDELLENDVNNVNNVNDKKVVATTEASKLALTSEQKDLIDKILANDVPNEKQTPPKTMVKTIKTISDITKKEPIIVEPQTKKIKELEDNVAKLTLEIDKLKNNQKYIVRALNRLVKSGSKK